MRTAAALKFEIEAKLAHRIPAALSPLGQPAVRLLPTGVAAVDALLGGGLPLGSVCELTGLASSGRTSLALAILAEASRAGACAYVDVGDTLHPHSAAAAGVRLRNLLWIRFAEDLRASTNRNAEKDFARSHDRDRSLHRDGTTGTGVQASAASQSVEPQHPPTREAGPGKPKHPLQQGCGGAHPRTETKGLAPALQDMLLARAERRQQRMEGTPGHPNQPLTAPIQLSNQRTGRAQPTGPERSGLGQKIGLGTASQEQVDWERFNCRKPDEEDPLRLANQRSAVAARAGLLRGSATEPPMEPRVEGRVASQAPSGESEAGESEAGKSRAGAGQRRSPTAWPHQGSPGARPSARPGAEPSIRPSAREDASPGTPERGGRQSWGRLDAALRATDQVLQAGGFRVVVLDLAALRPEEALRVPSATWWRYRRAVQGSNALLVLLTGEPCARSSAACVLQCAGEPLRGGSPVMAGVAFQAEVARQRTGAVWGKKSPGRVAGWQGTPMWMRAAGQ